MAALRVALFVEGSKHDPLARRGLPFLEQMWREHLPAALGLRAIDVFEPIAKTHLLAMDADALARGKGGKPLVMSGRAEPLDKLMRRTLDRTPFDVAVVAWDLVPPWNKAARTCRWAETLALYQGLANTDAADKGLPEPWPTRARERHAQLTARARPGDRSGPPAVVKGAVLAVCMEPMFEGLLVQRQAAVRRALGVANQRIKDWPRRGWADTTLAQPDRNLLAPAIDAVRAHRPRLDIARHIRGDLETHKNEWEELLLRRLLADDEAAADIRAHPLAQRLIDLLGR